MSNLLILKQLIKGDCLKNFIFKNFEKKSFIIRGLTLHLTFYLIR